MAIKLTKNAYLYTMPKSHQEGYVTIKLAKNVHKT